MTLNLHGRIINYEVKGIGPVILLIHGWGGSLKSLENLTRLLSVKYKTITLDLPGFGKSEKPDPDWGVKEFARFLIDFICELKLRPVFFFGHSFGGALGLYLAANYPSYIKKLILSGGSYKREKPTSTPISRLFKWLPIFIKIIIYKVLYPQSDRFKLPSLEVNFRKIITQDLTPILPSIKLPTLILWGEADIQTPVELAKELNKKVLNSRLKIFPGIGHDLPLKYPEKVYHELTKFL